MSVHDGRGTKPLPEKEISLEHRCQTRARRVAHTERRISSTREKQSARIKPKLARATKTMKTPERPRSSRGASSSEKLICRYCASDDLAPSFRKRRDARCRACFKKRYGLAPQGKKTTRKTKAAE